MTIIYHNGRMQQEPGRARNIAENKTYPIPGKVVSPAEPLSKEELKRLAQKAQYAGLLNLYAEVRTLYIEKYKGKDISEKEWLTILAENPVLIQRPIVEKGDKAIIARPPEKSI